MSEFVVLSSIFLVVDISWMVMVWVATSVGTPTQPKGRDEYLRWDQSFFHMVFVIYHTSKRLTRALVISGNSSYSRCSSSTASLLHSLLSAVSKSIRAVKITMDAATNLLWRPLQILDCFTTSSVCWLFRTLSNCLCGRPSPRIKSCDGFVITKWYGGVDMQRKRKGRDSSNVSEGCWNVYLCVAATSKVERKSRIREKWKISQAIW